LNDFKVLVDEAHQLGFKVIIDWVANHTGWDHEWTIYNPEYYVKDAKGNFTEKNGWRDVIDLNYQSFEMRQEMINAMRFWVNEFNIDGFRCDMAHLVPLDFWMDARNQCDSIKDLYWLAECEDVAYHDVFDTTYSWNFMQTTEKVVKNQASISDLYNILHGYSQYPEGCTKLFFTSNHDENSWNGTEYEKYNNLAESFAVFTCTWSRSMPLIYSGQETANKHRLSFFDKDEIKWSKKPKLSEFYKSLLVLHKTKSISIGETFILPTNNSKVISFLRKFEKEVVLVILNLSDDNKIHHQVHHEWLKGTFYNVFSGLEYSFNTNEEFELMANDYMVYQTI